MKLCTNLLIKMCVKYFIHEKYLSIVLNVTKYQLHFNTNSQRTISQDISTQNLLPYKSQFRLWLYFYVLNMYIEPVSRSYRDCYHVKRSEENKIYFASDKFVPFQNKIPTTLLYGELILNITLQAAYLRAGGSGGEEQERDDTQCRPTPYQHRKSAKRNIIFQFSSRRKPHIVRVIRLCTFLSLYCYTSRWRKIQLLINSE